jgi:hypothetical protein
VTAKEHISASHSTVNSSAQFGFGFLADIDRERKQKVFEDRYGHLPSTMPDGVALYRQMIDRHHDRMMAGDVDGTMGIRREAHDLAIRLNNGQPGICAPNGPGRVLERETAAPDGIVPKWGQIGSFTITVGKMQVGIQQHGIFSIGARHLYWPGFAARAVSRDQPFLSETGYRSFLSEGLRIDGHVASGVGPDGVASEVIFQHIARELKGKLRKIVPFEPIPRAAPSPTPSL